MRLPPFSPRIHSLEVLSKFCIFTAPQEYDLLFLMQVELQREVGRIFDGINGITEGGGRELLTGLTRLTGWGGRVAISLPLMSLTVSRCEHSALDVKCVL